jgi:hypothetical protein
VPLKIKTEAFCLAIAGQLANRRRSYIDDTNNRKYSVLKYAPPHLMTEDFMSKVVALDSHELAFVPYKMRTEKVCRAALEEQSYWAMHSIPYEIKTAEFCLEAAEKSGGALLMIPEKYKTPEICRLGVAFNGALLQNVPEEYKTPELCLAAVQQSGGALEYVPEALQAEVKKAAGIE